MTDWIKRGERIEAVRHYRQFDWPGEPNCGFAFPCDEQGNLVNEHGEPLNSAAMENYQQCLSGSVDGRAILDRGVVEDRWTYWEPGVLRCVCGAELVIEMLMTNTCNACIKCGQEEDFGWHTMTAAQCEAFMRQHETRGCANPAEHHEFDRCARDYNSSGQLLAPREQWGWDTGESLSDILMSDSRLT